MNTSLLCLQLRYIRHIIGEKSRQERDTQDMHANEVSWNTKPHMPWRDPIGALPWLWTALVGLSALESFIVIGPTIMDWRSSGEDRLVFYRLYIWISQSAVILSYKWRRWFYPNRKPILHAIYKFPMRSEELLTRKPRIGSGCQNQLRPISICMQASLNRPAQDGLEINLGRFLLLAAKEWRPQTGLGRFCLIFASSVQIF